MRNWESIRVGDRYILHGNYVRDYVEAVVEQIDTGNNTIYLSDSRERGKIQGQIEKKDNGVCGVDLLRSSLIPKPYSKENYKKRKGSG